MICSTLQVTNMLSSLLANISIFDYEQTNQAYTNNQNYGKNILPFDFLTYVFWWIFIWQGTQFHVFFSKKKVAAYIIVGLIKIGVTVLRTYLFLASNANAEDYKYHRTYCVFVHVFNLANALFIYGTLTYYGHFRLKVREMSEINPFVEDEKNNEYEIKLARRMAERGMSRA